MEYIDLKFKDAHPDATVERIRNLLRDVGVELKEYWNDSGIDHCQSVNLKTVGTRMFGSNGKGITRELARASAYGEFIERLQCGMQRYKYQTYDRDPEMYLHAYAPDAKYMTVQELEENGEWMDYLIRTYPSLTRKKIAKFCKGCAFTKEDKILTVPFYSLFEDKYVYIPVGYMEIMYTANGCCAGNTREEAWLHALSEIFERKCHIDVLIHQKAIPKLPESYLRQFPTISKILDAVRENSSCILEVLDFSGEVGYPVVGSRIIDKKTHGYAIVVAADPVVEIAIERSLTELFQGRRLNDLVHTAYFLDETNIPTHQNIVNQLNSSLGAFSMEFFSEELVDVPEPAAFPDNSGKSNKQLLHEVLDKVKKMGYPVYVRNFSYLKFDCYKIIIPGFSETRGQMFSEMIPTYFLGYNAARTMWDPAAATDEDLQFLLSYYKKISALRADRESFSKLAGMSFNAHLDKFLSNFTLSYANYRLGNLKEAAALLTPLRGLAEYDTDLIEYYLCVSRYLTLKQTNASEAMIRNVIRKIFEEKYADRLFALLDAGGTPYDDDLLCCDHKRCQQCNYKDACTYNDAKEVILRVGKVYADFTHGQDKEQFMI